MSVMPMNAGAGAMAPVMNTDAAIAQMSQQMSMLMQTLAPNIQQTQQNTKDISTLGSCMKKVQTMQSQTDEKVQQLEQKVQELQLQQQQRPPSRSRGGRRPSFNGLPPPHPSRQQHQMFAPYGGVPCGGGGILANAPQMVQQQMRPPVSAAQMMRKANGQCAHGAMCPALWGSGCDFLHTKKDVDFVRVCKQQGIPLANAANMMKGMQ
jgi:TolA-binding protein